MKNGTKKFTDTVNAYASGTIAFKAGLKRIPSSDKNLLEILKNLKVGESGEVLSAWLNAWDSASINNNEIAIAELLEA